MKSLVIGGSGGIGEALVRALYQKPELHKVVARWHSQLPAIQHSKLEWVRFDVLDRDAYVRLLGQTGALDYLINSFGFLHGERLGPEKSIRKFDPELLIKSIEINTLPTLLLAKYGRDALAKAPSPVFPVVSARVGSIEDNGAGGWHSYRCSKASASGCEFNRSVLSKAEFKRGRSDWWCFDVRSRNLRNEERGPPRFEQGGAADYE